MRRWFGVAVVGVVACAAVGASSSSVPVEAGAVPLVPGESICPSVTGEPGAVAVLNLTPVNASAAGYGALRPADTPSNNSRSAPVSNVNFAPGTVDPNVAFASLDRERQVCFDVSGSASVDLVADQLGTLAPGVFAAADKNGAKRIADTRVGFVDGGPSQSSIAPGGAVCPRVTGDPGGVAVLNLTPVDATGSGYGAVRPSNAPANDTLAKPVSNVNFRVGSVDPNVALVMIGPDERVCFDNSPHSTVQLVADQMGWIGATTFSPASASGAVRLLDTRGQPPLPPGGSACVSALGAPGDIAVINGTPVEATGAGYMAARAGDAPSNNTATNPVSNWNFAVGSIDPNLAFVPIGADGKVCVDNSFSATVHVVLDEAGVIPKGNFTPASASGAMRVADTRADDRTGQSGPPSACPVTLAEANWIGGRRMQVDLGVGGPFIVTRLNNGNTRYECHYRVLGDGIPSALTLDIVLELGPTSPDSITAFLADLGYQPIARFTPHAMERLWTEYQPTNNQLTVTTFDTDYAVEAVASSYGIHGAPIDVDHVRTIADRLVTEVLGALGHADRALVPPLPVDAAAANLLAAATGSDGQPAGGCPFVPLSTVLASIPEAGDLDAGFVAGPGDPDARLYKWDDDYAWAICTLRPAGPRSGIGIPEIELHAHASRHAVTYDPLAPHDFASGVTGSECEFGDWCFAWWHTEHLWIHVWVFYQGTTEALDAILSGVVPVIVDQLADGVPG